MFHQEHEPNFENMFSTTLVQPAGTVSHLIYMSLTLI